MLLGGLRYLLPVIDSAHKLGCHVITCDYLPGNIAHKYSDEYHNISILDKDAVLDLARRAKINGIMSFAVDPGVVTAAYVAEKMGLPFAGSLNAIEILQDKSKFRKFLADNNFNVPNAKGYSKGDDALKDANQFHWPVIVKPVDSAGSKGVSKVDDRRQLPQAINKALKESHSERFIIEDFLEKDGDTSDSDCFSVDGNLVYMSFSSQLFDDNAVNPYTPSAYAWPSSIPASYQVELTSEVQRLMTLLGMRSGIYNIETRVCKDGKAYIMEVSPRGGGNRLAEMLRLATGTDLIMEAVKAAIGEPLADISAPKYEGYWAEVILHGNKDGVFKELVIEPGFRSRYVVQEDVWVESGAFVEGFAGANNAIGTLVMRFESEQELVEKISQYHKWVSVAVE